MFKNWFQVKHAIGKFFSSRYFDKDKGTNKDFIPPVYFVIFIAFIFFALTYPCFIAAPLQICCSSSRATKMKRAWKKRYKKREKLITKNNISNNERKPLVDPSEYLGGEADILMANRSNHFSYEELVSIVHCTSDTLFAFDPPVVYSFFDYLDTDASLTLSPSELRTASTNVSTLLFLHQANSYELRRMLKKHANKNSKELTREEWGAFMTDQKHSRLLYYKSTVLGRGKFYYGKGMEPGRKPWLKSLLPEQTFKLFSLYFPRGWLQDYAHFLRNTHPVVSAFYASVFNPFTRLQRFELMFIDLDFCFVLTVLQIMFMDIHNKTWRPRSSTNILDDNWTDAWTSFFFVTVPQVAIQRILNELSRSWRVADESEKPRNCLRRRWNFCLGVIGMNMVTSIFFLSAAAVVWMLAFMQTRDIDIPSTVSKFITNFLISYATMLVAPLLQEFNPSKVLCELACLMQDVRAFLRSEAADLVGSRVVVYNSSHLDRGDYLADVGKGVVLGVDDDSGKCIVKLDHVTKPFRSEWQPSVSLYGATKGGVQKVKETLEDEGCYLVDVANLARLDLIGSCVAVELSRKVLDAEKQDQRARSFQWRSLIDMFFELSRDDEEEVKEEEEADVYTCVDFDVHSGLYSVSCLKSDELLYFAPEDVRKGVDLTDAEAAVTAAAETVVSDEEGMRSSMAEVRLSAASELVEEEVVHSTNPMGVIDEEQGLELNMPQKKNTVSFVEDVSEKDVSHPPEVIGGLSVSSDLTTGKNLNFSNFVTVMKQKKRTAEELALGLKQQVGGSWVAVEAMHKAMELRNQAANSRVGMEATALGGKAHSMAMGTVNNVKAGTGQVVEMYSKAHSNVNWVTSKARAHTSKMIQLGIKAAELAAARAASAENEAKLTAQRFARHPLGKYIGPVLGWMMLDLLAMCSWRREQEYILQVIRESIASRGAEHMSDPFVELKEVPKRQAAARELEPEQRVRVVGPERYESGGSDIDVSKKEMIGEEGVIVEGGSKLYGALPHLVTRGIHWRHLTSDFKVYVQLPIGLRVIPADWIQGLETPTTRLRQSHAYDPSRASQGIDLGDDVELPQISSTETMEGNNDDRLSILSSIHRIKI